MSKQLIIWLIDKLMDLIPFSGYRTYIINGVIILAFVAAGLYTGEWGIAGGFIGMAISNLFHREGVKAAEIKTEMLADAIEQMLESKSDDPESAMKLKAKCIGGRCDA